MTTGEHLGVNHAEFQTGKMSFEEGTELWRQRKTTATCQEAHRAFLCGRLVDKCLIFLAHLLVLQKHVRVLSGQELCDRNVPVAAQPYGYPHCAREAHSRGHQHHDHPRRATTRRRRQQNVS